MKALFPSKSIGFLFDQSSNTYGATKYVNSPSNAFLWHSLILITALLLSELVELLRLWTKGRTLPDPPSSPATPSSSPPKLSLHEKKYYGLVLPSCWFRWWIRRCSSRQRTNCPLQRGCFDWRLEDQVFLLLHLKRVEP